MRSVTVLAGGTAAGQVIVLVAMPVLTRLYAPDEFGLLAVFMGVLGLVGVISSLRYELAIPLPETDREAAAVALLALVMTVATAFLSAVVLGAAGNMLAGWLNTSGIARYLWLVPIGLLLVGIYRILNYWAIRTGAFSAVARTKLSQASGMVGVQIFGSGFGPGALLVGRIVGQSAGIVSLAQEARKSGLRHWKSLRFSDLGAAALRFRNFPFLSTWTGLLSAAGMNLPPLLIASLLGPAPAGMYALTHRVLSQPMAVIGKAVGDVFYRQAAEARADGTLGWVVETVYQNLVAIALPPAVTLFIAAPAMFELIFGANWTTAGEMVRWMTPWLFCQLVVAPPTRLFPILDKHKVALWFQLGFAFSAGGCVLVGAGVLDSLMWTIVLLSTVNGGIYLARIATAYYLVGLRPCRSLIAIGTSVPWAIACNTPLVALWVSRGEVGLSTVTSAVSFLISVVAVASLMFFRARDGARFGNVV